MKFHQSAQAPATAPRRSSAPVTMRGTAEYAAQASRTSLRTRAVSRSRFRRRFPAARWANTPSRADRIVIPVRLRRVHVAECDPERETGGRHKPKNSPHGLVYSPIVGMRCAAKHSRAKGFTSSAGVAPALAARTRPCAKCRRIASARIEAAALARQRNSTSGGSTAPASEVPSSPRGLAAAALDASLREVIPARLTFPTGGPPHCILAVPIGAEWGVSACRISGIFTDFTPRAGVVPYTRALRRVPLRAVRFGASSGGIHGFPVRSSM
jgi:hypothetical protein